MTKITPYYLDDIGFIPLNGIARKGVANMFSEIWYSRFYADDEEYLDFGVHISDTITLYITGYINGNDFERIVKENAIFVDELKEEYEKAKLEFWRT